MDPDATLELIADELRLMDDPEQLDEHCQNLFNWIRRGGSLPSVSARRKWPSAWSYYHVWNEPETDFDILTSAPSADRSINARATNAARLMFD